MTQEVQVPGVGTLQFPDGMSQPDMAAAIQKNFPQIHAPPVAGAPTAGATGDKPWELSDALLALPETLAHFGSGAIAAPVAGLAGALQGGINAGSQLFTGKDAGAPAADVVSKLSDALTYQPRTQGGKDLTGVAEYLPKQLGKGADVAGSKVAEVTGSPALGAGVNTAIQALPAFLLHEALPVRGAAAEAAPASVSPEVQAAADLNLKLTPEQAQSGIIGRTAQSLSGSAKLERSLSRKNAPELNQAVLDQAGIEDTSPAGITAAKAPHNAVYDAVSKVGNVATDDTFAGDIAKVGARGNGSFTRTAADIKDLKDYYGSLDQFDAGDAVQEIRQLRSDSTKNIKAPNAPNQNALGYAQRQVSQALEDQLDRHIQSGAFEGPDGQAAPDLIGQFQNARQKLAQIHSVEDALDDAGNVSAKSLHQQLDRGVPLTGNLKKAAEAYGNFPRSLQDLGSIRDGGPFSVLDGAVGPLFGAGADALTLARPAVRAALGSDLYQHLAIRGGASALPKIPASAVIPAELSAQQSNDPRLTLAQALQRLSAQPR